MIVGENSVVLETYDDSRLDRLVDRFTAAARSTIPPAHPRTKVIEKVPRHLLALSWQWSLPTGLSDEDVERLHREQRAHIIGEVWPKTPLPALRGRTPIQAAKAGDAETTAPRRDPPARVHRRRREAACSTGTGPRSD